MLRKVVTIRTEKQFTDLTQMAKDFVKETKGEGSLHIYVKHTTCAIKIIENEILLLADINNFLNELMPHDAEYMHNKIEIRNVPVNERINAHSHLRQLFLTTSETIPVSDGELLMGKWQTCFLIEFDPIRDREVVFSYTEL